MGKSQSQSVLFLKTDEKNSSNYRPISLVSVPYELMEKKILMRDSVVKHMLENNLFRPAQHLFIKGRSCVTQLLEFLENVTQAIANGEYVDTVYLDFCKAFDKVPHKRLLKCMDMEFEIKFTAVLKNFFQKNNNDLPLMVHSDHGKMW